MLFPSSSEDVAVNTLPCCCERMVCECCCLLFYGSHACDISGHIGIELKAYHSSLLRVFLHPQNVFLLVASSIFCQLIVDQTFALCSLSLANNPSLSAAPIP